VISRRSFILGSCATAVLDADNDLAFLSLAAASDGVRKKKISRIELAKTCLQRIERINPQLNAYITVTAEAALTRARELEAEVRRGRWRGPLHGIPVALKDNTELSAQNCRTTARRWGSTQPESGGKKVSIAPGPDVIRVSGDVKKRVDQLWKKAGLD
jgi:hypothetical protein